MPSALTPEQRGKRQAYLKAYRLSNADRLRAWHRENYKANRARMLEVSKKYHSEHPEIHLKASRKYQNKNRELIRIKGKALSKRYRTLHPEKAHAAHAAAKHRRRALEKNTQVDPKGISSWMRQIRSLPFVRCHWCGTKVHGKKVHFDHVVALNRGGSHTIGNLCASCAECNQTKSARVISDWIVGGQTFFSL